MDKQLECGLLTNIVKRKGSTTYCISAKLVTTSYSTMLTYDCKAENLVIHNWFKLPQKIIPDIMKEVITYMKTIQ